VDEANLATKKFVKRKLEGRKLSDFFNGEAAKNPNLKLKIKKNNDFGRFQ